MAFVDKHRFWFGVEPICRVLAEHGIKIAPSTYYARKARTQSARAARDEVLTGEIDRLFWAEDKGRGVAGVRKMWHLMRREGHQVARCTVERLMRAAGLRGVVRGKKFITTRPDLTASRAPDHVNRNFKASRPNELWVVDFTYVPTWAGMAFTAFVTDVYSRRIVGWRTQSTMPTQLPLDALEMAIWVRDSAGQNVTGVVHHSDAGTQYTALRYSDRLADVGAVASIGTIGDSYDNALAESIIGLYKTECVRQDGPFKTADELELATLSWVYWYNQHRLHSAIGYRTPAEAEHDYYAKNPFQHQPVLEKTTLHQTRDSSVSQITTNREAVQTACSAVSRGLRSDEGAASHFASVAAGAISATDGAASSNAERHALAVRGSVTAAIEVMDNLQRLISTAAGRMMAIDAASRVQVETPGGVR